MSVWIKIKENEAFSGNELGNGLVIGSTYDPSNTSAATAGPYVGRVERREYTASYELVLYPLTVRVSQ